MTEPEPSGETQAAARPPVAPRRAPARPSRGKRFAMTFAAAAAGFVIVFEFLALQLRAANNPAPVPPSRPGHSVFATVPSSSSPVVTRASAGAQPAPTSTAATPTMVAAPSTHGHSRHVVHTRTSGGGATSHLGERDDLE